MCRGAEGALHSSAHRFRWTSPSNGARRTRVVAEEEAGRRRRRRGGETGLDWTGPGPGASPWLFIARSPEKMSEFFLVVFLALFSGLFPCAEPSAVSDEGRGKNQPGRRGCAVRGNLAPRAALVRSGPVNAMQLLDITLCFKPQFTHDEELII
ncbi:uncharacterized protein ACO6RY_07695 [Pungitius sinensis]